MAKSFVNVIIIAAIVVVGFLFMPIYYMGVIDIARSQEILLDEVRNMLDKASDTRELTEVDMQDFALAMGSTTIPVKYEILREMRVINPDPASTTDPQETYTTWVPVDLEPNARGIYEFNDGDFIIVRVEQVGENFYQSFASRALGMYTPEVKFTLSRMVR